VTFHDLRHFYASLLIRAGESVKSVQRRLGHKSAVETLDTYSHLWPDSEDRTREAVDAVLGRPARGGGAVKRMCPRCALGDRCRPSRPGQGGDAGGAGL
jgi:hypothetical protein